MGRWWIVSGAVFGFLGVALGAFGAHALQGRLDARMLEVFEVGVRYQMYHALALILVGVLAVVRPQAGFDPVGWPMLIGVLVFSGSLYALALSGVKVLGAITPIGGTAFLIGWAWLAWRAWQMG